MILLGLLMMFTLYAGDCAQECGWRVDARSDQASYICMCLTNDVASKIFHRWLESDIIGHHTFYSERFPSFSSADKPTMSKKRRELERMACLLRFANRDKKLIQQQADARKFATHAEFKSSCIKNKAHHINRPIK